MPCTCIAPIYKKNAIILHVIISEITSEYNTIYEITLGDPEQFCARRLENWCASKSFELLQLLCLCLKLHATTHQEQTQSLRVFVISPTK